MSGTTGSGAEIDIGRVCGTVGCGGEVGVDILHRRGGCGDGGGEDVFFFWIGGGVGQFLNLKWWNFKQNMMGVWSGQRIVTHYVMMTNHWWWQRVSEYMCEEYFNTDISFIGAPRDWISVWINNARFIMDDMMSLTCMTRTCELKN